MSRSSSSSSSLTRWQSFQRRQQHRSAPQQALRLVGLTLLLCCYTYALFGWQPNDRLHHEAVQTWNTAMQEKARIEAVDRHAKRIRAGELILQARQEQKQSSSGKNETTTKKEGVHRDHDVAEEDRHRVLDILLAFYLLSFILRRLSWQHEQQQSYFGSSSSTTSPAALQRFQRRLQRLQREQQQRRHEQLFQAWADRLNQQRQTAGQAPIPVESLRLVMRERDLTDGNDYERLLQFEQENNTGSNSLEALVTNIGATEDEIARCPVRTIASAHDDLLRTTNAAAPQAVLPTCAICLETYELGQTVRTIPCFHTFHQDCIDPWLRQRAVCPVCKHSALA